MRKNTPYILNVAYTIKGKHYLTSQYKRGNSCIQCEIDCKDVSRCDRVIFKHVRESHKGRRCIKSDFKVGAVIWYVGDSSLSLDRCKLAEEIITRWLKGSFCMLVPFTTRRAAKAYQTMMQKKRKEPTNG